MSGRETQRTGLCIVAGAILGGILGLGGCCVLSWYRGGSADPRCALSVQGYATLHFTDAAVGDRIRCVYQTVEAP